MRSLKTVFHMLLMAILISNRFRCIQWWLSQIVICFCFSWNKKYRGRQAVQDCTTFPQCHQEQKTLCACIWLVWLLSWVCIFSHGPKMAAVPSVYCLCAREERGGPKVKRCRLNESASLRSRHRLSSSGFGRLDGYQRVKRCRKAYL